jgi:hypothetical protein
MRSSQSQLWLVSTVLLLSCSDSGSRPTADAGDGAEALRDGPIVQLDLPDGLPQGGIEADIRDAPAFGEAVEAGGQFDASPMDGSAVAPVCAWPTPVDAGPGACRVGRFHLECHFPEGATCDSGQSYTGTGGVRMLCVSDDPTGCPGCHPTSGSVTCTSKCAANQYATSCGGPPMRAAVDGGGYDPSYYEEPAAVCSLVTPTPSGMAFWCCPCP